MGKTTMAMGILASGALFWLGGCGDDGPTPDPAVVGTGNDGGAPSSPWTGGGTTPLSPWMDLDNRIAFSGGAANTPAGQASAGGDAQLISNGAIAFDKTQAAPSVGDIPTPAGARSLSASDLAANVAVTGTTIIEGNLRTDGDEAERSITVTGGDLYIQGQLRGGSLPGTRQALRLTATGGTVYVVGQVNTAGGTRTDANGQTGGAITIDAQRIVVVGELSSAGGASAGSAGGGGAITLSATESIVITGVIDSLGGDAKGTSSITGGRGGDVTIRTGTDLVLNGKLRSRGGAATAASGDALGGAAGGLTLDAGGGIFVGGSVDGRGGLVAGAAPGTAVGGAAGTLRIGMTAAPTHLAILSSSLSLDGGAGTSIGGNGGALAMETRGGALLLAGVISVDGGDSSAAPGVGGTIVGKAGHDAGTRLAGRLSLVGGSITAGGTGNGAEAGTLTLTATSIPAPLTVDESGEAFLDGGESGGAWVAGGGGHLYFITQDGDISMAGKLWLRGGTAPDSGGTGGLGGAVDIFCDRNTDGFNGDLTIEPQGFIDASGGPGTIGGSGRNDGGWGIANFPEGQEQISVLLNSDGIHGTPKAGVLLNLGTIITKGAAGDGWGGDVMFHGRGIDTDDPLPGHVEADASGKGQIGQVGME